jgi:redox-sensitive bicupin YhaK (pirin superfamily)
MVSRFLPVQISAGLWIEFKFRRYLSFANCRRGSLRTARRGCVRSDMIKIRKSLERGHLDHGWLDTYHTFSFDQYFDPGHMHFRSLRVINEDRVAAARGFPTHSHRDMEIITYILSGALEHRDSMGNGSVIRPGDVQRMTAGTGVSHSEFNPSQTEPCHLLQIWILPESRNLTPGYEQKFFSDDERQGRLRLIASRDGNDGAVTINQDARVYASLLDQGQSIKHTFDTDRYAWLQLAGGSLEVNGENLIAGDGAAISKESHVEISAVSNSEFLLFDLA